MLEVVLCVLIIGTGVLLVMRSFTTALRNADIAQALTRACFLLEDTVAEADMKGFNNGIEDGDTGSACAEPYFRWKVVASLVEDKSEVKLERMDMSVAYERKNQQRTVHVVTYLRRKGT